MILHYNAYEMTCECIDCLLAIMSQKSEIVIVDNYSNNDSGLRIDNKYGTRDNIYVIHTDKNLGFAGGNNVGYFYAKNELGADIIVDMNNDVLIYQKDFEARIVNLCSESSKKFDVLSPNIINKKGFCQNPYRIKREKTSHLIKSMLLHALYYTCLRTGLFREKMYERYHKDDATSRARKEPGKDIYNIVPHGSCIIFMKSYIVHSDFAFVPKTFFYAEEDFLYDFLILNNMKTFYTNRLEVWHMEKVSTNTVAEEKWKRERFQVVNKVSSRFALLRYRIGNHLL